jgi:hypothetical protein
MRTCDDFSSYLGDGLQGTYDCMDRISLRSYFPMGQASGGFIMWWNRLYPGLAITEKRLRSMAGDFARRVRAFARKKEIPFLSFAVGDKTKHSQAAALRPTDPNSSA